MKKKKKRRYTPIQAIHEYCITRCLVSPQAVTKCKDKECPNFDYKDGHDPYRKGRKLKKDSKTGKFLKSTKPKTIDSETIIKGTFKITPIVEK